MKLTAICPMSDKRVNKWIARLNAYYTFSFLVVLFF
jgi:hypothetical protein